MAGRVISVGDGVDPGRVGRAVITRNNQSGAYAEWVRGIQDVWVEPAEMKRLTAQALAETAAGRIKSVIGQTFPLERAADAHAAIEDRKALAKTLLLVRLGS